jgi:hypothetical protein
MVHENGLRERPIGELVKELAAETSQLVRQEIDLAKAEITQKGKQAGAAGAMFGAAGGVALLAGIALTLVFIAALATAMQTWLAALIVTVVYLLTAAGLAIVGRGRLRKAGPPVPKQTIETVKEDVEWAKTLKPSARK